jgi:hypothetical protein
LDSPYAVTLSRFRRGLTGDSTELVILLMEEGRSDIWAAGGGRAHEGRLGSGGTRIGLLACRRHALPRGDRRTAVDLGHVTRLRSEGLTTIEAVRAVLAASHSELGLPPDADPVAQHLGAAATR